MAAGGTIKVNEFGLHLLDQNRPFCDMGVERYDVVDLRGCDPSHNDADCPAGAATCLTDANNKNGKIWVKVDCGVRNRRTAPSSPRNSRATASASSR